MVILLISMVAGLGFLMLYSAGGGSYQPWAEKQMIRYAFGMVILLTIAVTNIRFWMQYAYYIYGFSLIMLIAVEVAGSIGMGAQRWIDLYIIRLQPSELVKITLIIALARYFHIMGTQQTIRATDLVVPALLVLAPTVLVLKQPDLGTAILLMLIGLAIIFWAGLSYWIILGLAVLVSSSLPVLWTMLHQYQRERILTFLNPERDPFGAGYHILQSKIAFGSGGLMGRGFLEGSQSHLDFLPEKQTDFIFSMFCEEFGFTGGLILIGLYAIIIAYTYSVGLSARNTFCRLVSLGFGWMLFVYMFVNMAMVMGLLPVVGIPLPLVSYGGTSMMTLMMGFGLLFCADLSKDQRIGKA
ncbi:MAG: rod shape-determining protein RodA [Alphaproteobacteria bacterium]